ncbi:MAG: hypothetical protein IKY27_06515 [Bacteroidales bacterium]|nr:hypothetical protein [Bacteroidales bacterium]
MKRHLGTISVIAFISFFMLFSNSCHKKAYQDSIERLEKAKLYHSEAIDLYENDSLKQTLSKFIDVLALIETLPENMTEEEKHLASKTYCNISRLCLSKLESNIRMIAIQRALYYQNISEEVDTIVFSNICLTIASMFQSKTETDSILYYLNMAKPYIDSTYNNGYVYLLSLHVLSTVYYNQEKFDSCFQVKRDMIAYKSRNGLDAKIDSMTLGIQMFHSPYRFQSKPYLLKALEYESDDITTGMIMLLLEKIYQEENNSDSVAFCQKYYKSYAQAEISRVQTANNFFKLYDDYAEKRDAKLEALREQKDMKKRMSLIVIAFVILVTVLFFIFRKSRIKYNKQSEHLNSIIADSEFKHSLVDGKIKKMNVELRKKEELIKAQEMELDEMKQKMERLENAPNIEAYYKSDICQKIVNRKATDFSALTNEDFALLIQAADKHLNKITARLKDKYPKINKDDMYYICLILLNVDLNKMQYLLDRNPKTVWYRLNKIKSMMGLETGDDILMYLMKNFIS